ncbi:DTDP-4-dehydrorhamnose 3,5-epimerase [gamma proteobacterium HdN1]|nr:DTDP-4-dehydrorhamnose 3,5-epimerase [gamma proteobacterium HdN1]
MKIHSTAFEGVYEIGHTPLTDERGCFTRLFCEREMTEIRSNLHFTQVNWSQTKSSGTVRGMHYQMPPAAEAKLIRCLHGRVFDVIVDLRPASKTFLQWHATELSEDNFRAIFVPEGFAHGFQSLSENAHLLYMHTVAWTPACEAGLRHDDPRLAISWPLPVLQCSERDRHHPLIDAKFTGILL